MLSVRRTAIQPQEGASLLDSAFAAGEEALLASPVSSISRMSDLRIAKRTGKQIGADDARAQIESRGLRGRLTIPDQGVTQDYLDILIDRKQEELRRAELIASAPQGFGSGSARFAAGFAASMLDPLNVATAFVPVIGQARYLKWLGQAGNLAGRTGVRAGVGAVEGLAGAALVEPLISLAKSEEQADYDMNDSLANIAFGTVFGGGLHVMGGTGADLYRKIRGATNPWDLPELKAGREANAAVYADIEAQLLAAGRGADEAAANASVVASAFRSMSDVTGRSVDELYAEWGPRISFAREGEAAYAQGPSLRAGNELIDSMTGRTFDQPAYHGTPHDIGPEGFKLDKIGTGEGAQAYGWGLYFAENPAVAGDYARSLSNFEQPYITGNRAGKRAGAALDDTDLAVFKYLEQGQQDAGQFPHNTLYYARKRAAGDEAALRRMAEYGSEIKFGHEKARGSLYQVDIADAAVAKMLDWDKPLSEQPEIVKRLRKLEDEFGDIREQLQSFELSSSTGMSVYAALDRMIANDKALYDKYGVAKLGGRGSDQAASRVLNSVGIPGIRYLDQGSRRPDMFVVVGDGLRSPRLPTREEAQVWLDKIKAEHPEARIEDAKTEQTRNIVVFDEGIVKITHKDGSPVTAAERKEFLQSDGGGALGKRGSIDLAKGRRVNITLFQKADRSTFIHETGHLFLEMLDSIGGKTDAPDALKADLARVREWVGLKEGEAFGEKHHEQFARGMEAYVREGRAPTPKLTKVFERFKDWLVGIYKDIRALDVALSDDVRGVYDRLIAGYPAAKKVELAGPAKREAALKAAVAQAVTGRKIDVEGIINGDQREVLRAAKNPESALVEPPAKPFKEVPDDTSIEMARESLGDIEATIKAGGDEAVIRELDDLDEIVAGAKAYATVARKLAPCIGGTDG